MKVIQISREAREGENKARSLEVVDCHNDIDDQRVEQMKFSGSDQGAVLPCSLRYGSIFEIISVHNSATSAVK